MPPESALEVVTEWKDDSLPVVTSWDAPSANDALPVVTAWDEKPAVVARASQADVRRAEPPEGALDRPARMTLTRGGQAMFDQPTRPEVAAGDRSEFSKGLETGVSGAHQMASAAGMTLVGAGLASLTRQLEEYDRLDAGGKPKPAKGGYSDVVGTRALLYARSSPERRVDMRAEELKAIGDHAELRDSLMDSWNTYATHIKTTQGKTVNATDIKDAQGFVDWFNFNVGQGLPYIAASTVTAVLGSAIAGPPGAAAGLVASGLGMGTGDIATGQLERGQEIEPGAATGYAVPYAALELIGAPARMFRGVSKPVLDATYAAWLKRTGKEAGKSALEEFVNEAGQEAVKDVAVAGKGEPILTDEALVRWFNAGAAGAATGAVAGGGRTAAAGPKIDPAETRARAVATELDAAVQGGEFSTTPEQEAVDLLAAPATHGAVQRTAAPQQPGFEVRQPIEATPVFYGGEPAAQAAAGEAQAVESIPEGQPGEVAPEAALSEPVEDSTPAPRPKPRRPPPAFMSVDAGRDTLTTAIAKLGGLSLDESMDITGEKHTERAPNNPMRFVIRRNGGESLDGMAEALMELGYITEEDRSNLDVLRERIRDELDGTGTHYSTWGDRHQFEEMQRNEDARAKSEAEAVRFAEEEVGIPEYEQTVPEADWASLKDFVPAKDAELGPERTVAADLMSRLALIDEAEAERIAMQSEGKDDAQIVREIQEALDGRETDEAVAGGRDRVGEAVEPFALARETESERASREAGERAGRDRDEREADERESRARADREREGFGLTGSERQADADPNQGNLYNLRYAKTIQRTTEEAPKKRIYVSKELKRLVKDYDDGLIAGDPKRGDNLANEVEHLVERVEAAKEPKFRERVRGPDWVIERLHRARRLGEISPESAELALWLIDKNPVIANELGISLRKPGGFSAGHYNPMAKIIMLTKESENTDTAAHEILHHTERMMPEDVRDGITSEWLKQFSDAYRNATPENRPIMREIAGAAAGEPTATRELKRRMEEGKFPYELYQYTNPSEFWAVNGARILSARFDASRKGWVAQARQWLKEFIEKLKSIVGMASDAPVIRALENVLQAEGEFVTDKMLTNSNTFFALQPNPKTAPSKVAQAAYVGYATKQLGKKKMQGEYRGLVSRFGMGIADYLVTPRTIAVFKEHFVPVYRTAIEEQKFLNLKIAEFETIMRPYLEASPEDAAAINKVFEHDRLTGQYGLAGKNMTVHFTAPAAVLTRPGERITVTDAQKTAYWAARHGFDRGLDLLREQTAKDYGFPGMGSQQILATLPAGATGAIKAKALRAASEVKAIEDARRNGYVPFMRYGDVGLTARNAAGEVIGYTHVETGVIGALKTRPAKQIPATQKRLAEFRAQLTAQGHQNIVFDEPFQVPPSNIAPQVNIADVDVLAEIGNVDPQVYEEARGGLVRAQASQGHRQHLFRSKNTAGYSTDFQRSSANYIISLAGHLARREHADAWRESIADIPLNDPQLRKYAKDYEAYFHSPGEEFSFLRTVNFVKILTSPATAAINMTQVPFVSVPWATQFAPSASVATAFTRAEAETFLMLTVKKGLQMFDPQKAPADVRTALVLAFDEGEFIPVTTYEAIGQAQGKGPLLKHLSKPAQRTVETLGIGFTTAERINRITTFIALYRLARDNPKVRENFERVMADNALARLTVTQNWSPATFADFGVDDTQFRQGKVNRQRVARKLGTLALQFKSGYLMQMLERIFTMMAVQGPEGRAAAILMMMIIGTFGGIWALPGATDIRDLWEWLYKKFRNRDLDLDAEAQKLVYEIAKWAEQGNPAAIAEMATGGVTRGLPDPWNVDLSKRVSIGKVVPRDLGELAGVTYDTWGASLLDAARHFEYENYLLGLAEIAPKLLGDPMVAAGWAKHGVRTIGRDSPVIPPEKVTQGMLTMKMLGFTSGTITNIREGEYSEKRAVRATDDAYRIFYRRLAKTAAEGMRAEKAGDPVAQAAAVEHEKAIRSQIEEWNKDKPHYMKIIINPQTVKTNLIKEFEGADYDKGQKKQARDEIRRLREVRGR